MTYEKLVFNFFIIFSCGTPTKGSFKEPPFVDSHITCGRDFIQLDVKLNPKIWERVQSKLEMHLIDKYCKPFYVNSTHASIRTPLYDCGTNLEVTKDHMIFSNSFMMSEEPEVGQLVSYPGCRGQVSLHVWQKEHYTKNCSFTAGYTAFKPFESINS